LADEIAVEFAAEELGARGLLQRDAYNIGGFPRAGLLQEGLVAGIVVLLAELALVAFHAPAGEGAGGFANVRLRVVADADGEQLQELAAEVLVGLLLLAAGPVEPGQHRRIAEDPRQEIAKWPQCPLPKQLVLLEHLGNALYFAIAGGEVAVPEE